MRSTLYLMFSLILISLCCRAGFPRHAGLITLGSDAAVEQPLPDDHSHKNNKISMTLRKASSYSKVILSIFYEYRIEILLILILILLFFRLRQRKDIREKLDINKEDIALLGNANAFRFFIPIILLTFLGLKFSCSDDKNNHEKVQVDVKINPQLKLPGNNDYDLSDVDFLSVSAAIYNDTLNVKLVYINKEDDVSVQWAGDELNGSYTVYRTDYYGSSNKLEEILSGEKMLKRGDQSFYIDTAQFENSSYYFIVCRVDTGYLELKAQDTFQYNESS